MAGSVSRAETATPTAAGPDGADHARSTGCAAPPPPTAPAGRAAPPRPLQARRPAAAPAVRPERQIVLTTPEVRFVFSSLGGTLIHAQLREPQFLLTKGRSVQRSRRRPGHGSETGGAQDFVPRVGVSGAGRHRLGSQPAVAGQRDLQRGRRKRPRRKAVPPGEGALPAAPGRGRLQPRRQAGRSSPGDRPGGWQDPDKRGGGFFSGPAANPAAVDLPRQRQDRARFRSTTCAKEPVREGRRHSLDRGGREVLPARRGPLPRKPAARTSLRGQGGRREDAGQVTLSLRGAGGCARTARSVYPFTIFAGPKRTSDLGQVGARAAQRGQARRRGRRHAGVPVAPDPVAAELLPSLHPQLGPGDRPADAVHQDRHLLPDAEVAAVGQADAEAGAEDERDPQEVRERPAAACRSRR